MKSTFKFLILIIAVVVVILYFLFFGKKTNTNNASSESSADDGHCITPPAHFKKYDKDVNWGDFAKGVRDYLGDYDKYGKYALAFLKCKFRSV